MPNRLVACRVQGAARQHSGRDRLLLARGFVGLLLLALVASGCSGDDDSSSPDEPSDSPSATSTDSTKPADSGVAADLRPYYRQDVEWSACDAGECATVNVPVDYDKPDDEMTELALARRPAGNPDKRIGTLFINPGGPGGSGIDYLEQFVGQASDEMLARYDIVGFDPRGVASSDPVDCLSDEELDAYIAQDPSPETPAEVRELERQTKKMGKGCLADAGALAKNMSTVDVAKDLDVLRGIVGDDKLHFAGASYGTFIGSTYAELFPKRVGRLMLDGAIDPSLSAHEATLAQSEGFNTALKAYVKNCIDNVSTCPLNGSVDAGMKQIGDFLDQVDKKPLDSGDADRPLTESLAVYGIVLPLYDERSWPALTQGLSAAFAGDGAMLLRFADLYFARTSAGFETNQPEAQMVVNCLDSPTNVTPADIRDAIPTYEKVSPVFGEVFAWMEAGCASWPIKPDEKSPKIDGSGADPILVVGTTRDPATPYEQSVALADQLDSGVLLSRDGDGHTAYHRGNACIDKTIDAYLLEGEVPKDGKRC
ncbi:MAG: alpha/beta hydrolase [Actinomycetia bacterium]|nr:alpha/beta hydrolase [Actinomycetes bacterium]